MSIVWRITNSPMGPRSSRVIEILRETILRAEQTPELGPYDPGVVELRRILNDWMEARGTTQDRKISLSEGAQSAILEKPL